MRTRVPYLLVGAAAALLVGCSSAPSVPAGDSGRTTVTDPAAAFLSRYVDPDGRVVRRDQGGDTVSEGQSYALLIALAAGDEHTFRTVWTWTRTRLQQPSGLFAFRWQDGRIAGPQPAADADLLIAWALERGGERFGDASLTAAARQIAGAIAEHEIGYDDQGGPLLTGGPWAVKHGGPSTVEPGYWALPAATALGTLTGDKRLSGLASAAPGQLAAITRNGAILPPDWVSFGGGANTPVPAPDGSNPVQSGQDGLRTLIWASCDPNLHALAGSWWHLVQNTADSAPLSRNLDGSPRQGEQSALSAVAAAAAARAAGDHDSGDRLMARAGEIDRQYPTYYGSAWLALGTALQRGALPCST